MIKTFIYIWVFSCAVVFCTAQDSLSSPEPETEEQEGESLWSHSFAPTLGMTFISASKATEESENFQWLAGLTGRVDYEGESLQWHSSIFARYGQYSENGSPPVRTQDNLIVTLRPSIMMLPVMKIRLFFETTGETAMGEGDIPETDMSFLDPLFLYQTLFAGQRYVSDTLDEHFDISYGIGYSFQQTYARRYVLAQNRDFVLGENNPLSSVQDQYTLESGLAAIFEMNYSNNLTEQLAFNLGLRAVAMGKKNISESIDNSRATILLTSGLSYSIFSIDYTNRLVYDRNISERRQIDQSLTLGLKLEL